MERIKRYLRQNKNSKPSISGPFDFDANTMFILILLALLGTKV